MIKYLIHILIIIAVCGFFLSGSTACSTGIERTKTVKLSKADKKFLIPAPEDIFMDSIAVEQLNQWKPGKSFRVADNKVSLLYEVYDKSGRRCHEDSLEGKTAKYIGIKEMTNAAGNLVYIVNFYIPDLEKTLQFRSGKDYRDLMNSTWADFPFLIDEELVALIDERLRGREVWIKTPLWYDKDGVLTNGSKFIPVRIISVTPGTGVFAMNASFTDGKTVANVPMNMKGSSSNYESRSFSSLFSLNDPKLAYPGITPEIWEIICRGCLTVGMTKEECKLSLGNPKEVDTGHDWNSLMDYWKYDDGTYLLFQDGRLINYRK